MTVSFLSDRDPKTQLPDVGGKHYEVDDISIDLNHIKPGEENSLYFISPCEFIGFPVGLPTHIDRAYNSDLIKSETVMPDTIGCTATGARQYLRVSDREIDGAPEGYRVVLLNYNSMRRQSIEDEMTFNASFPTEHNFPAPPEAIMLRQSVLHFLAHDFEGGKLVAESLVNLAIAIMLNILNKELNTKSQKHPQLKNSSLNHVLEYIEENLDQNIGLGELGNIAAMSSFHFSRCFKSSVGKSPHSYVIERRIEKAKELLTYSHKRMCDITLECGFSSQSHFSAQFKRRNGVTPSQYRNRRY